MNEDELLQVPTWKGVWLEYLFQCLFTSIMCEEGWSGCKV